MNSIKGPAIFLAQFLRDEAPYNSLENIAAWATSLGFKGLQLPSWDKRVFDLDLAAESQTYCDDLRASLDKHGLVVTELNSALQGQTLAMHPAYKELFSGFYPANLSDNERVEWCTSQLIKSVKASVKLGTTAIPTLSGGFAWHLFYPWPQRPAGIIEEAFTEMAKRWMPALDAAKDHGLSFCYELHPGSDLFDGATFEMFLDYTKNHPAACINYDPSHFVLQQLDYLHFIELYGDRIKAFHVKDAEFRPSGRQGVYSGYASWADRAGRFRSLGDGQVDFKRVFTLLTEAGYRSWAVMEWECAVKSPEQGAREGAPFIAQHLIEATEQEFDDFVGGESDAGRNKKLLGLD